MITWAAMAALVTGLIAFVSALSAEAGQYLDSLVSAVVVGIGGL